MFHSPVVLGLSGRRPPDDLQHSCESWDAGMNDRPHHVKCSCNEKEDNNWLFIHSKNAVCAINW